MDLEDDKPDSPLDYKELLEFVTQYEKEDSEKEYEIDPGGEEEEEEKGEVQMLHEFTESQDHHSENGSHHSEEGDWDEYHFNPLDEMTDDEILTFMPFPPNFVEHMQEMRRRVDEANKKWNTGAARCRGQCEIEDLLGSGEYKGERTRRVTFKGDQELVSFHVFERDECESSSSPPLSLLALQNEVSKKMPPEGLEILENMSLMAIGTAIKKPGECGDGLETRKNRNFELSEIEEEEEEESEDCDCHLLLQSKKEDDITFGVDSPRSLSSGPEAPDSSSDLIRTVFNLQNILLLQNLKKHGGATEEVKKQVLKFGITKEMLTSVFSEEFLESIYTIPEEEKVAQLPAHPPVSLLRPSTAPSKAQQGKKSSKGWGNSEDTSSSDCPTPKVQKSVSYQTCDLFQRPKSAKFSNAQEPPINFRPNSSPAHLNSPRGITRPSSKPRNKSKSGVDLGVVGVKSKQESKSSGKSVPEFRPKLRSKEIGPKTQVKASPTKNIRKPGTRVCLEEDSPENLVNMTPEMKLDSHRFEQWLDRKRREVIRGQSLSSVKKPSNPHQSLLLMAKYGQLTQGKKGLNSTGSNKKGSKGKGSEQTEKEPTRLGRISSNLNCGPSRLMGVNPKLIDTYNVYRYGGPAQSLDAKIIKSYFNF